MINKSRVVVTSGFSLYKKSNSYFFLCMHCFWSKQRNIADSFDLGLYACTLRTWTETVKDICTYTISKKYTLQLPRCFLDLKVVAFLVDLSPANLSLRGLNERSRHSHTLLRHSGCQNKTCWSWSLATLKPKRTADITCWYRYSSMFTSKYR